MTSNPFDSPEFRKEMTELLDKTLGPLSAKVDEHETAINRSRGAMIGFAAAWSGLIGILEYLFHRR